MRAYFLICLVRLISALIGSGAKEFFCAEADLASAEVGGANPDRLGMASGQGMTGLEEGDDCTVM